MSSLADFVNEQRSKSTIFDNLKQSVASGGDFRMKMSSSINSLSSMFSQQPKDDDDASLIPGSSSNGQLGSSRNRKTTSVFSFSDTTVCGLSRLQRIVFFFLLISMAGFCFVSAGMLIPILVVSTRKFALLNTLGSVFFIASFSFLWGPLSYLQFMFTENRRLVAVSYFLSLAATLYSSIWLKSTIATCLFAVVQAIALVWFVFSFVPGGERGLRFITSMCSSLVSRQSKLVLPI